jgi:hypothetical protein
LLLPEPHTFLAGDSWYEGIIPFPSGTSLTIDATGIVEKKYWSPCVPEPLPYTSETDLLDAFRELFLEIVGANLGRAKPAASLLSGGLDSSSIVAAASHILAKENRELDVFAGVLADSNDPTYTDEKYFIDQFKSVPNIRINYVSAPNKGPFSELEDFFEHYGSPFVSSRHFLYTAFSRKAHSLGAATLFDGSFGEFGPTSFSIGGFAELFTGFRWLSLWRELKLRKELYGVPIGYNIRAEIISLLLPQMVINLRHLRLRKPKRFNEFHPLQSDFAASMVNQFKCEEYFPNAGWILSLSHAGKHGKLTSPEGSMESHENPIFA